MTTATANANVPYPDQDTAAAVARALAAARDRPNPAEDAACSPQKYAGMSRNFRAGAWKHLQDDKDLAQASNKAWGWWPKPSRPSAPTTAASSTTTAPSGK